MYKRQLLGEAVNVTILDTFVAVMAGLMIFPACFAYGIEPNSCLLYTSYYWIYKMNADGKLVPRYKGGGCNRGSSQRSNEKS